MRKNIAEHGGDRSRVMAFIIFGLLSIMIVLGLSPTILAQEGADPDPDLQEEPVVYVITSEEDLQNLPDDLRIRFQKEGVFGAREDADLSGSTISVSPDQATPGSQLTYSIIIVNSGDVDIQLSMVDKLPNQVEYVSHMFQLPSGGLQTGGGVVDQTVTWEGVLGANGSVAIDIVAKIKNGISPGTQITNEIEIIPSTAGFETIKRSATMMVSESSVSTWLNLPFIIFGEKPLTPNIIGISASRPNSQNAWTVSWTSASPAAAFELEQAQSPDFSNAQSFVLGPVTSKTFNYAPTPYNVYFYRVRSRAGTSAGLWSDPIKVVGGYADEFADAGSGWDIRRTSHIDEVQAWYEIEPQNNKNWHILQVEDRWDLGISSPLKEAPVVPYVIEMEVKDVHPGWQKGLGLVLAGDYPDPNKACPDKRTVEGWYEHKLCFNEFYEIMLVDRAEKKDLQVQRIHEVVWLEGSGGIPVHRKVAKRWYIEKISGVSWDDYNRFRIEVRQNSIHVYIGKRGGDLKLQLVVDENMYPANPYFGVIATTQEYSNMTGRYEFFNAQPLNN